MVTELQTIEIPIRATTKKKARNKAGFFIIEKNYFLETTFPAAEVIAW